ncbi:type II secretion system protein [Rubritalea tangerina]|uniref:type II secretion system protein n=1 Tax=Rubritalea tangerina TaxID=430798 RepID=UPI003618026A
MTLIELTVVISMIISLISALFVSAKYYREASDRSACIAQISQIQKAVRSYQNLNNLTTGDIIEEADFIGPDTPFEQALQCPSDGGEYTYLWEVPASGVPFAFCAEYDRSQGSVDPTLDHTPENGAAW